MTSVVGLLGVRGIFPSLSPGMWRDILMSFQVGLDAVPNSPASLSQFIITELLLIRNSMHYLAVTLSIACDRVLFYMNSECFSPYAMFLNSLSMHTLPMFILLSASVLSYASNAVIRFGIADSSPGIEFCLMTSVLVSGLLMLSSS